MNRKRDRDVETINMEGIDANNIIREKRRRNLTITQCFELLKTGDYRGFLNSYLIKQRFAQALDVLGSFGQGHSKQLMTHMWHLCWEGKLVVTRLEKRRPNVKCVACRLKRRLKAVMNEVVDVSEEYPDGLMELGVMGSDCYFFKFKALIELAETCKSIADYIDSGFNEYDERLLTMYIDAVVTSPAKMAEHYRSK